MNIIILNYILGCKDGIELIRHRGRLLPVVRPATELTRLWSLFIWQDNLDYVLVAATVHQMAVEERL